MGVEYTEGFAVAVQRANVHIAFPDFKSVGAASASHVCIDQCSRDIRRCAAARVRCSSCRMTPGIFSAPQTQLWPARGALPHFENAIVRIRQPQHRSAAAARQEKAAGRELRREDTAGRSPETRSYREGRSQACSSGAIRGQGAKDGIAETGGLAAGRHRRLRPREHFRRNSSGCRICRAR